MTVNFMGLTGPTGVLPYAYSELILERVRAKDHEHGCVPRHFQPPRYLAFLSCLAETRFPVTYSAGARDLFTRYLLDLVGLGTDGLRDRQEIDDEALLHYISLVGMQSRSAAALEQMIEDYFEVPVEIQQFTGAWYGLDESTQCAMSERTRRHASLAPGRWWAMRFGTGRRGCASASDRWAWSAIPNFCPAASAYEALRAMTRFFSNQCLDFEVQLVLDRTEAPGTELDCRRERSRRAWAGSPG